MLRCLCLCSCSFRLSVHALPSALDATQGGQLTKARLLRQPLADGARRCSRVLRA